MTDLRVDEFFDATLRQARLIVGNSVLALLGFSALLIWFDPIEVRFGWAPWIGGLVGLVAPAIGYRIYTTDQRSADPSAHRRFLKRNKQAIRITEIGGFIGLLAWLVSHDWTAVTGLATHTLLAGAIWPTPERLENFLRPALEDQGPPS